LPVCMDISILELEMECLHFVIFANVLFNEKLMNKMTIMFVRQSIIEKELLHSSIPYLFPSHIANTQSDPRVPSVKEFPRVLLCPSP